MKECVRRLLSRLIRREAVVLDPRWRLWHRGSDFWLAANAESVSATGLPVSYPFHVARPLCIEYRVHGEQAGTLSYSAMSDNGERFADWKNDVRLPVSLILEERGEQLFINGSPAGNLDSRKLRAIRGEFRFTTLDGGMLRRNVVHRLRQEPTRDSGYFTGDVYGDYESNPGMRPEDILGCIARYRATDGKLLDLGCATGLLVAAAMRSGLDAEGVDASVWACEQANTRTGGRCRVLNLDTASASDFPHQYCFITGHSILEHVADPKRLLRLSFDLLASGGIAMFQTLNADSLMHRVQKKDWSGYSDPTHLSPWITASWLEKTCRSIGFEILMRRTYGVWNDRGADPAWRAFGELLENGPASVLLSEGLGDFVEIVLQKTCDGVASRTVG